MVLLWRSKDNVQESVSLLIKLVAERELKSLLTEPSHWSQEDIEFEARQT